MMFVEVQILPLKNKIIINASDPDTSRRLLEKLQELGVKIVQVDIPEVRCG